MSKAIVIFSGGQDSTTCLGWAKNRFDEVEAVSFDYGQRHKVEIVQAEKIAEKLKVPLHFFDISFYAHMVLSALTGLGDVGLPHAENPGLPASFVPNRNALFILLAHSFAQKINCKVMVGGFCQTDYSGYPDCRQGFVDSFMHALNLGSDRHIRLDTPLMHLDKAQTFHLAKEEGVLDLVLEESHTCYEGTATMNPWGRGCGTCPACVLRKKGYQAYLANYGS